jgi:hypothetical protein
MICYVINENWLKGGYMKLIPVTPKLEYLCRGEVQIGEVLKAGVLPSGEKRIVPLTCGHFEGKITGGGSAGWR